MHLFILLQGSVEVFFSLSVRNIADFLRCIGTKSPSLFSNGSLVFHVCFIAYILLTFFNHASI